jgi:hypothetical protein
MAKKTTKGRKTPKDRTRVNPQRFVTDLKKSVRESVSSDIDYFANPPVPKPPGHLGRFSTWYRSLSVRDKKLVADVMRYAAEGSLFGLLGFIDNLYSLPSAPNGRLELYYAENGSRIRLNEPEGDLLQDVFNNTD